MKLAVLMLMSGCSMAGQIAVRVADGVGSSAVVAIQAKRQIKNAIAEAEREERYRRLVREHREWLEGKRP